MVEIPRLAWWPILHGIILWVRPGRSAASYRKIWTERGSPLMFHTATRPGAGRINARAIWRARGGRLRHALRHTGHRRYTTGHDRAGVTRLLVLPLYPQYSGATTGSTFDALAADFTRRRWLPELRFVSQYHDHPAYIEAIADSIQAHRARHGTGDKLLFSYHGEPRRYLDQGDPYHCQCHKTTRLVAQRLEPAGVILPDHLPVPLWQGRMVAALYGHHLEGAGGAGC